MRRNISKVNGEAELLIAVLCTAVADANNRTYRQDVARFAQSAWCTYLLDHLNVCETARQRIRNELLTQTESEARQNDVA